MPTLRWLTREEDLKAAGRAPYRLLEHVETYGEPETDNMIIQGDNLDGLKALLPYYAGQVKCVYIDPPYNTRSAFEHYDDNLEHAKWLSMMYPRLEILRELLSEDGSIWVTLDDNEAHYMKVIMDEIFGRKNFIATISWQKRTSPDNRLRLGDAFDTILVSSKDTNVSKNFNQLDITDSRKQNFKNLDDDPRGQWASTDFTGMTGHATPSQFYTIVSPTGKKFPPPSGRCWALAEETFKKLLRDNKVWFGKSGNSRPRLKRFLSEMEGQNAWTWWPNTEVGHTQESKKEIKNIFGDEDIFDTPKPERLIQRVLHIATNPGDLVLDSFLGSGTTAAVAHKMGRRYIGMEIGEHAVTHCVPRLQKVIAGEQGGISKAVNWQGGGGFRFYRLGEPIFAEDGSIRPDITFTQLAAHVWFTETHTHWKADKARPPLLGVHNGTACYLLYNGVLKDKSASGGNALNTKILDSLPVHDGPKVVYGARCLFNEARLKALGLIFRHTPYDIKGR